MSRIRASTVIAALVAIMAMIAIPATAASAAPQKHYPAPPPILVVNKGVVKKGTSVKATGRQYAAKEQIYITVVFRPKGTSKWKTVKTTFVRADKKGKFSVSVRMQKAGYVIIKAVGSKSRQAASTSVYVREKNNGGGGWLVRSVSFDTALPAAASPATAPAPSPAVAAAGIGALALAGSALITRQTIRRRRRA